MGFFPLANCIKIVYFGLIANMGFIVGEVIYDVRHKECGILNMEGWNMEFATWNTEYEGAVF